MNVDKILLVMAYISAIACVWIVIMYIKCVVAYNHHIQIIDAIHRYHMRCFYMYEDACVEYSDMEESSKTVYRLWDWTNKRILPKEKFAIIKPFMK